MGRDVALMGESRKAYGVLVWRPEGKRPLGRPRRRWEDNIKMDLREVGYDGRDWFHLAQDRDRWRAYVRAEMNLRSAVKKEVKARIYKTVILGRGCQHGCETWTLTLREEQRLRVFENKVLRKIFGAKRDEVTGEWRKLHNAELHALYPSPDIIRNIKSRRLRWARHVARMGESRNAYRVVVGRPEGKRPLGRPRRRWEDNIKMDLREVGYDDRDWINLAQDRDQWRAYVREAINLRFRHPVGEIELSAAFCYELQASGKSRPQRIPTSFDVPTSDGLLPKANQTIGLPLLRRTHSDATCRFEGPLVTRKRRSTDFKVACPHPVLSMCIDTFVYMGETRKAIVPPFDVRATSSVCELRLRVAYILL
ncbi:hypothetical protein ANN_20848 [Periplaneta americana]|uniref:Uncharacterized protein n=1 Tax=Periplaneta americana TaxID=6978 RepID=A0ABQ8SF11_PERAM|nr:hypothetical protein ANN_20848 [Periplaneta americana]